MGVSRQGHHGDFLYTFEDAGFDTAPTDTTMKTFGSNVVMDTFEGGRQAERKYNASREAAEIIAQNFDGGWGVSFDINTPPWWLAAIYGQPTSTSISGALYDYDYDLANNNDPVTLRGYAPTDGFNNYEMLPGMTVVSMTLDQSQDASPDVTLTGGYARDPVNQNSPAVSVPNLPETTYSNRDAEVTVDATTVAKAQNTSLDLEANTDLVSEIGTDSMVDYVPGAFNPSISYEKIVATDQSVDLLQRFRDGNSVTVKLAYDNGLSGEDEYSIDWNVTGSFPDSWSQTGRNDPESRLLEELQDMALDCNVTVTTSAGDTGGNPPGITL